MNIKKFLLVILAVISLCFTNTACTNGDGGNGKDDPKRRPVPFNALLPGGMDNIDYSKIVKGQIFKATDIVTKIEYDYIYFGKYPKNEVIDRDLHKTLSELTTTNESGYYQLNDKEYAKVTVHNNYTSLSHDYNDNDYLFLTGYAPTYTYFFEVVPLLWRVLSYDSTTNVALILTSNIIELQDFSPRTGIINVGGYDVTPINYEFSEIRTFLNNDFFQKAFGVDEMSKIQQTTLDNSYVEYYYTIDEPINDTNDYVFLLSYKEVTDELYGFQPEFIHWQYDDHGNPYDGVVATTESLTRHASATDYARAKGVYAEPQLGGHTSLWYLRNGRNYTPGFASTVNVFGDAIWGFYTHGATAGVRAACYIQL